MGLPGHSPSRGKNGASGGSGGGNAAIGNDKERATSESSTHDSGPSTSTYVQQRRSTGSSRFKFLSGKRGRELSNLFHRHSTHHSSSSHGHSATSQNHSRETSVQKENSSSFSPQPPPPSITKQSESEAAIESKRSSGAGGEDVGCSLESRFGTGAASSPNLRHIRRMNLFQQAGPPTGTPIQGRPLPPSSSSTGFNTHAHHHLGIGGLHTRRESFLYRADDRDSYYNPLFPSAAGRPISRASSVTSSDPQLVFKDLNANSLP